MKHLLVEPIPVPKDQHPEPESTVLMKHEFTMGLIGKTIFFNLCLAPKGSGKTTVICNLLMFYKGYFNTIIVFSPTIESDEKWDYIKRQTLLSENKRLRRFIEKKRKEKEKKEDTVVETESIQKKLDIWDPYIDDSEFDGKIPEHHFFDDYDEVRFMGLMEEQKRLINLLKEHGGNKYLANRVLIIFDDLVGSALFSGSRGSYFKGVNTRHRHYSTSFLMVSQGYKEIPKTIRTNWTGLIVFEIGNEKEVEVIYEEYAMGLKRNPWMELYRYATNEEFSFMYINFQKEKHMRIMKNFSEYLHYDE